MESENEKYKKVVNILRNSKPVLGSTENIEREVIKKISGIRKPEVAISDVIDFVFGWIYIGWVRRTLIAASILLVVVFVWQQGVILNRIDLLSSQAVVVGREKASTPGDEIEKVLTLYKNSGRKFSSKTITISERDLEQIIESVNQLQGQYKDLLKLIEEDPELKKLIEDKVNEKNLKKIKL
jgi:hypothetical protein